MTTFTTPVGNYPVSGGDQLPPVFDEYNYTGSGAFGFEGVVTPVIYITASTTEWGYTGSGKFAWEGEMEHEKFFQTKGHGNPPKPTPNHYDYTGGIRTSQASRFIGAAEVHFSQNFDYDYHKVLKQPKKTSISVKETQTAVYFFDQLKYIINEDEVIVGYFSARTHKKDIKKDDEEVLMLLGHLNV